MRMELDKSLRKKTAKYGSLLKAYRTEGSKGGFWYSSGIVIMFLGLILGAVMAIFDIYVGMMFFGILVGAGAIFYLIGKIIRGKMVENYMEYYQEETGYSVEELQEADKELMSQNAVMIGGQSWKKVVFIVTDHYFLSIWPTKSCYLRKLNDIVAAFYSDEIPGNDGYLHNLFVITQQDTKMVGKMNKFTGKKYRGFENKVLTDLPDCPKTCAEALAEIQKRAPHIITCQKIAVNGKAYNLLSMDRWEEDWIEILEK